jgi:predicted aldo/keto reductase-like oxidoreductase
MERENREVEHMKKRVLGATGLEVGVIGLGVEHLSTNRANMDEVFDLGVSAGADYVDLVYNDPTGIYAEHWRTITPALQRHRDRLTLAAHWGFVAHEPVARCRECFDLVLDRVGNDHVELAVLTMVDTEEVWNGWAQESIELLEEYRSRGRVGFIGLSNHYPGIARQAVESGLIDVLMFPVNLYVHHEEPECRVLLEVCSRQDVGVVAMKPYYGGRLLHGQGRRTGISPVQCLHYVLSQPVATVVPGVRNAQEFQQALDYVQASGAEKTYVPLHEELTRRLRGQCVLCRHCLPCPEEISIPDVIHCLDYVEQYGHGPGHESTNRQRYASMPSRASACTECGTCMERCPFQVDVIGKMRRAVQVFEGVP